jgi:hypothetical protein
MQKIALIIFIGLMTTFLILQVRNKATEQELPTFLNEDVISNEHETRIEIKIESQVVPESVEIEKLKSDYANIWAHLNNVYATNDILASKIYFTEAWFKQLALHYKGKQKTVIHRQDTCHHITVTNWASDGLVCSGIDSNIVFRYTMPNQPARYFKSNIAFLLLYQGDNWRIDAINVLDKVEVSNVD